MAAFMSPRAHKAGSFSSWGTLPVTHSSRKDGLRALAAALTTCPGQTSLLLCSDGSTSRLGRQKSMASAGHFVSTCICPSVYREKHVRPR